MAVLGPSGCGKTTLLRLIAGFLTPDEGTVAIDGAVVADRTAASRPAAATWASSRRKVRFSRISTSPPTSRSGCRGTSDLGPRVTELMDLLELPRDLAHRRPSELSGGQQQRVAVARALAPEPAVLLLDEPFSSLDAALRSSTGRSVVNAIRAHKATAVLVTHDQDEALSLADKVGVMDHGQLLQADTPSSVYAQPASPFVASFVGEGALLPPESPRQRPAFVQWRVAVANTCRAPTFSSSSGPSRSSCARSRPASARSSVAFHGHDAMVRMIDEECAR